MSESHTDGPRRPTSLGRTVAGYALVRVVGSSMAPTLLAGDVLVVRVGAEPKARDIVVAQLPGDRPIGIKRVLRRDADGWWLERDNPREGTDSWTFGALADSDILAVAKRRIWPIHRRSLHS